MIEGFEFLGAIALITFLEFEGGADGSWFGEFWGGEGLERLDATDLEHEVVAFGVGRIAEEVEADDPGGDGEGESQGVSEEPPEEGWLPLFRREIWILAGHGLFAVSAVQCGIVLRFFSVLGRFK